MKHPHPHLRSDGGYPPQPSGRIGTGLPVRSHGELGDQVPRVLGRFLLCEVPGIRHQRMVDVADGSPSPTDSALPLGCDYRSKPASPPAARVPSSLPCSRAGIGRRFPTTEGSETCDTLHAHCQVLGKLAVRLAPPEHQLQHAALRLTARGWETAPLPTPDGSGSLVVVLDLRAHETAVEHSSGRVERVALTPDRAVGVVNVRCCPQFAVSVAHLNRPHAARGAVERPTR